ncbi:Putative cytochrome P450 136 [BD1-7 clade bacterium]|uniref:Cytochrome P450 136 n=1 Tax=BD1-7 clade bacterium TaxID=2029982 RepID=A0A5S9NZD3_9GAMM|nr:Putative cytochrome P450 136 [BD1-7 clade bacterium]CAA0096127.1 Putative cytochrome P450 136 [BD1-7 clade bacterium]
MTANEYTLQPDSTDLDLVPGTYGWPMLGEVIALLRDFNGVIFDHVEKYGNVSRLQLGIQKGLLVTHPDDLQPIYLDKDRNMSSEMGYAETLGRFYGGGLALIDFDVHKAHRRIFQNAFKTQAIRGYLDIMNPTLRDGIEDWGDKSDFHFFDAIKSLLLGQASDIFLGLDKDDQNTEKLSQAFLDINEKGLLAIIRKEIPGLAFHRGMEGKRFLYGFLQSLIAPKRDGDGKDLMSILVKERDENGDYFSDDILLPHLAFLLFGAHDTTTATLTNMLMYLARPENQALKQRVYDEVMSLGKTTLDYEDLDKLPLIEQCMLETLRLHPPVPFNMRRTLRETTIGGYRVPANTILYNTPVWAGRSEEFWTDPLEFDPDRWGDDREEQKIHNFAFIGFGGGAHKCIGMHFAMMQAKVFLNHFMRTYDFSTAEGYNPKVQVVPMPKPVDNLPMTLRRRS